MGIKKKGTGISELLIGVFIIIYILLPLFCSIVNKAMFYHQINKIEQSVEMAVISLISNNNIDSFSSGLLSLDEDNDMLKYLIADEISKACINTLNVNSEGIDVFVHETDSFCRCGYYSDYFMISADIFATLNFLGQRQMVVHKHVEFPVKR
ncbi:MAG TPA: hypothetical protein PLT91_05660 [Clostridia bacterium]|jgi:hypothetical protein|nr:MAG: hypothetical protein BWX97_00634 [Firmicutes bacterium ADurb.Bin146]HOD93708.1 hypothetical protein [Clostridia bacterium]HQM39708.1 hypothetical protein [Clostridia bacterium]